MRTPSARGTLPGVRLSIAPLHRLTLLLAVSGLALLWAAAAARANGFQVGPLRVTDGYSLTLLEDGGWTFVDMTKHYPGAIESHDYSLYADATYTEQGTRSADFSVDTTVCYRAASISPRRVGRGRCRSRVAPT